MTIDDIASFCQFTGCEATLGDARVGFVLVDGKGLRRPNNYQRYLSHNELASLPSARKVLAQASTFRLKKQGETRILNRGEFEEELKEFRRKAGIT